MLPVNPDTTPSLALFLKDLAGTNADIDRLLTGLNNTFNGPSTVGGSNNYGTSVGVTPLATLENHEDNVTGNAASIADLHTSWTGEASAALAATLQSIYFRHLDINSRRKAALIKIKQITGAIDLPNTVPNK